MDLLRFIFVFFAVLNIAVNILKWIKTEEEQFSAICGWVWAILYAIE